MVDNGVAQETPPMVSMVLSFYNEVDVLGLLIDRLHAALKPIGLPYEFVFLDDCSTDGSGALLAERAESDPAVKVVTLSRNFGQRRIGACTMAGIAHATGDAIIMMDTDLSDPPEVVPTLITTWLEDRSIDVVYTTRRQRVGESRTKLWLTGLGYGLLNRLCDVDLPRDSGDFRLISRRLAKHLLQLGELRPFTRGQVRWLGFKQVQVYYGREPRAGGETHFPIFSSRVIDNFICALLSYSEWPLKSVFWVGILALAASLLALIVVAVLALTGVLGWHVVGWVVLALAFSTTWFMLGLVAWQLNLILEQVRGRPGYVVDSLLGFDAEPAGFRCEIGHSDWARMPAGSIAGSPVQAVPEDEAHG